jgi:hypothetical protein
LWWLVGAFERVISGFRDLCRDCFIAVSLEEAYNSYCHTECGCLSRHLWLKWRKWRVEFMAVREIELRVTRLEAEMTQLKKQLGHSTPPPGDWLDEIFGAFDNDPVYEEAMRLGREYRQSLRPEAPRKPTGQAAKKLTKRPQG